MFLPGFGGLYFAVTADGVGKGKHIKEEKTKKLYTKEYL